MIDGNFPNLRNTPKPKIQKQKNRPKITIFQGNMTLKIPILKFLENFLEFDGHLYLSIEAC